MNNALSGRASINESAHNSKGFFTEEEHEEKDIDDKILPIPTNKQQKANQWHLEQKYFIFIWKLFVSRNKSNKFLQDIFSIQNTFI